MIDDFELLIVTGFFTGNVFLFGFIESQKTGWGSISTIDLEDAILKKLTESILGITSESVLPGLMVPPLGLVCRSDFCADNGELKLPALYRRKAVIKNAELKSVRALVSMECCISSCCLFSLGCNGT